MTRVLILILLLGLPGWRSLAGESSLKVETLDNHIICVHTSHITDNFAAQLHSQLTNNFSGLVLDLRFTDGNGAVSVKDVSDIQKKPLIVLVNAKTSGSAAELAAQLQAEGRAILIGSTNLPEPLHPDIVVQTRIEDDAKYLENPFTITSSNSVPLATMNSNLLPFIDHTSEAELVRRQVKDGDEIFAETPRSIPAKPVIRDPALARAVDLLKAVAILQKSRG